MQAENCLAALEAMRRGAADRDTLERAIEAVENILKIER